MAETFGLVISPTISRVELVPGKEVRGQLTITNAFEAGRTVIVDTSIKNVSRYRVRSIPAAGALLKEEDMEEQQIVLPLD